MTVAAKLGPATAWGAAGRVLVVVATAAAAAVATAVVSMVAVATVAAVLMCTHRYKRTCRSSCTCRHRSATMRKASWHHLDCVGRSHRRSTASSGLCKRCLSQSAPRGPSRPAQQKGRPAAKKGWAARAAAALATETTAAVRAACSRPRTRQCTRHASWRPEDPPAATPPSRS
eukprot:scaffold59123_cov49-Phaeocystis_antarctica.AAC.1